MKTSNLRAVVDYDEGERKKVETDKKRRDVCESYPFFYDVGYKFSARYRINSVKKER